MAEAKVEGEKEVGSDGRDNRESYRIVRYLVCSAFNFRSEQVPTNWRLGELVSG